jgi:hypothetical protein
LKRGRPPRDRDGRHPPPRNFFGRYFLGVTGFGAEPFAAAAVLVAEGLVDPDELFVTTEPGAAEPLVATPLFAAAAMFAALFALRCRRLFFTFAGAADV